MIKTRIRLKADNREIKRERKWKFSLISRGGQGERERHSQERSERDKVKMKVQQREKEPNGRESKESKMKERI